MSDTSNDTAKANQTAALGSQGHPTSNVAQLKDYWARKKQTCRRCGRRFSTGLVVTGGQCPPCFCEQQSVLHGLAECPDLDGSRCELIAQWCDYYSLLTEVVMVSNNAQQIEAEYAALAEAERRWFAVGLMEGMVCELGFTAYFYELPESLRASVPQSLARLQAKPHLQLLREAQAIFARMSPEQIEVSLEDPSYGPLEELDADFYDLSELTPKIAAAALGAGLLKPAYSAS